MRRVTMMLSAFALLTALALPSWAQMKELPTTTETISGTIETIDQTKRAMNIKTADGKIVAVNVPESVKRFSELKVGDKLKATYNNNVIVRMDGLTLRRGTEALRASSATEGGKSTPQHRAASRTSSIQPRTMASRAADPRMSPTVMRSRHDSAQNGAFQTSFLHSTVRMSGLISHGISA